MLEEMKASGWYRKVWLSFAVLLPIQTVGVMGDSRTCEHVIALRAVDSPAHRTGSMKKMWQQAMPEYFLSIHSKRNIRLL
ncbi:MAG: hypothetical protein RBQ88_11940 [Desulfobulbus oligotrophicus]|nr:hypothetical protein [Desulfobulbus oligotrophicus]